MAESIYFVTALQNAPAVRERIIQLVPEDSRYELAPDKWMIAYDGLAQEFAEAAGIRGGDKVVGTGLVLPVSTYSGRAPSTLWDWLRSKGR